MFSYGGALIDPASGKPRFTDPGSVAGVDMYAKLLREAGPVWIASYHWMECLNDVMAGAAAIGCAGARMAPRRMRDWLARGHPALRRARVVR